MNTLSDNVTSCSHVCTLNLLPDDPTQHWLDRVSAANSVITVSWGISSETKLNRMKWVSQAMILHCKAILVTTWANEMNFGMNHAPGIGSIT